MFIYYWEKRTKKIIVFTFIGIISLIIAILLFNMIFESIFEYKEGKTEFYLKCVDIRDVETITIEINNSRELHFENISIYSGTEASKYRPDIVFDVILSEEEMKDIVDYLVVENNILFRLRKFNKKGYKYKPYYPFLSTEYEMKYNNIEKSFGGPFSGSYSLIHRITSKLRSLAYNKLREIENSQ